MNQQLLETDQTNSPALVDKTSSNSRLLRRPNLELSFDIPSD
jgi:hypothetical protein